MSTGHSDRQPATQFIAASISFGRTSLLLSIWNAKLFRSRMLDWTLLKIKAHRGTHFGIHSTAFKESR